MIAHIVRQGINKFCNALTLRFDLETDVNVVGGIIVRRHGWQFCPAYCCNYLKCSQDKRMTLDIETSVSN